MWRSRSGSLSDSECDTPDWSCSGAITQTSPEMARAMSSQTWRPCALMPSSLVTRIRMLSSFTSPACGGGRRPQAAGRGKPAGAERSSAPSPTLPRKRERELALLASKSVGTSCCSLRFLDLFHATHIALERIGHHDRAVGVLIGLHHRDQRAAD